MALPRPLHNRRLQLPPRTTLPTNPPAIPRYILLGRRSLATSLAGVISRTNLPIPVLPIWQGRVSEYSGAFTGYTFPVFVGDVENDSVGSEIISQDRVSDEITWGVGDD